MYLQDLGVNIDSFVLFFIEEKFDLDGNLIRKEIIVN